MFPLAGVNESCCIIIHVLIEYFLIPGQKAGMAVIARTCEGAVRERNSCRYINI